MRFKDLEKEDLIDYINYLEETLRYYETASIITIVVAFVFCVCL